MNNIARLCDVGDILLDIEVQDRKQLFDVVAQHVQRRHQFNGDTIARFLNEREKLGSTGLGQGVAIPHARIVDLANPVVCYVRLLNPIPFDAPDGKPVRDCFILLVPQHADQAHLQLLADAAGLMCERGFRDKLRAAATREEVHHLLSGWGQT